MSEQQQHQDLKRSKPDDDGDEKTIEGPPQKIRKVEESSDISTGVAVVSKAPKSKVAVLIGYDGSAYNGSQSQTAPNIITIEDVLFKAIAQTDAISEDNSVDMRKVQWSRASRTDRGVSAVINIMSMKLVLSDNLVDRMNEEIQKIVTEKHLTPLTVYGYTRVVPSFDPRSSCDGRKYLYILPTVAFEPITQLTEAQKQRPEGPKKLDAQAEEISLEELQITGSYAPDYRISAERLNKARQLFNKYKGTHSFHNFTKKGKKGKENSPIRFISNITVGDPYVSQDGIEHLTIVLEGQSFVLNQIRKMIGFVVAITRGHIPEQEFDRIFMKKVNFYIPMAPGDGLILDNLIFKNYNQRHGKLHGIVDTTREDFKDKIENFRQLIFTNVLAKEHNKQVMGRWIYLLPRTVVVDLLQPGMVKGFPDRKQNPEASSSTSVDDAEPTTSTTASDITIADNATTTIPENTTTTIEVEK
jgi:tRNA pseudouridine38-40 synthase